jgi:hypothetical protein
VNFWHDEKHWIYDDESKGRWGNKIGIGSVCNHYRWSFWRPSYRFRTHTSPVDVNNFELSNLENAVQNSIISPTTMIYHLGHVLPKRLMLEKNQYYLDWYKSLPNVRNNYDMWTDWESQLGKYGDGIVAEVDWDIPDIVKRAIASIRVIKEEGEM